MVFLRSLASTGATENAEGGNRFADFLGSSLSLDAYRVLLSTICGSRDQKALSNVRLASRGLRDLIDANVEELHLRLDKTVIIDRCKGSETVTVFNLCKGGRWLQRWPACRKITLDLSPRSRVDICLQLFASVPSAACQRIEDLKVHCSYSVDMHAFGAMLSGLLSTLPNVTRLELRAWSRDAPARHSRQALTAALSSLPRLTSMAFWLWSWLPCISHGLASQLTKLEVSIRPEGAWRGILDRDTPSPSARAAIASTLSRLTALQELTLTLDTCGERTFPGLAWLVAACPPSLCRFIISDLSLAKGARAPAVLTATIDRRSPRLTRTLDIGLLYPHLLLYPQQLVDFLGPVLRNAWLGRLTLRAPLELALSPHHAQLLASLRAGCSELRLQEIQIGKYDKHDTLDEDKTRGVAVESLAAFLAETLSVDSSRVSGLEVGRVVVNLYLRIGPEPPKPAALASIAASCLQLRLSKIRIDRNGTADSAVEIVRALGLPDVLMWETATEHVRDRLRLRLRPRENLGGAAARVREGGGGISGLAGGGGSAAGGTGPAPSLEGPSLREVIARMVQRLEVPVQARGRGRRGRDRTWREGEDDSVGRELILWGPFAIALLESPQVLRYWLGKQLRPQAAPGCMGPGGWSPVILEGSPYHKLLESRASYGYRYAYRTLPEAGAILLMCPSTPEAVASAKAVRRWAQAMADPALGQEALVGAHLVRRSFAAAVGKELQAMWDAEGAAGPGLVAGRGAGRGGAGEEGEEGSALDRLRWLLGAWAAVKRPWEPLQLAVVRPFAGAPSAACQLIAELVIHAPDRLPIHNLGAVLFGLRWSVPNLVRLELRFGPESAPDKHGNSREVLTAALSSLPRLTCLAVSGWKWLSCIGPGLAAQLTKLEVLLTPVNAAGDVSASYNPSPSDLASISSDISRLTALQDLTLTFGTPKGATFSGLAWLVAACPPSLRRFTINHLRLAHGVNSPAVLTATIDRGSDRLIGSLDIRLVDIGACLYPQLLVDFLGPALRGKLLGRLTLRAPLELALSFHHAQLLASLRAGCSELRLQEIQIGKYDKHDTLDEDKTRGVTVESLAAFLAETLWADSSRVSGLEVGRVVVNLYLRIGPEPPKPAALASIAASCLQLRLSKIRIDRNGTADSAVEIVRALGLPDVLMWETATEHVRVRLRPSECGNQRATAAISLGGGGGSGGFSRGGSGPGPAPNLAVPALRDVFARVLHIMSPSDDCVSRRLIIRGPFLAGLLENPRALHAWLGTQLRPKAATRTQRPGSWSRVVLDSSSDDDNDVGPEEVRVPYRCSYRALPQADAVVLACPTHLEALATMAAVRRHAAAMASGPGTGAVLQAHLGRRGFATAVQQELQAMWDGEGAAGPGVVAGEEATEDLRRLRWLLTAWEVLQRPMEEL
ncbi:hypothetical protein HYH03_004846 [Edaphochlamys debaryana]|uniref:Uncharacterized protein n=1 Tax=Edaphochlamys debaryana TaxID=47281 RepID=A0A836C2X3_9CHLO|nr:hypothetical protein HYH03_004846 [Edaphochlamys debaryana]|eukprot:KAG2497262.1 hypothetical protein HYH03_004846 [Edaphochlamys debaryana]